MKLRPRTARRLTLLIVVCGLVAVGVLVRNAVRSHQLSTLLDRARHVGLAAYHSDRYDVAAAKLAYFLSYVDNDLEVMLAYADTTVSRDGAGRREQREAIRWLQRVLELDPDNLTALQGLLGLYRQTSQHVACEDVVIRLLAIEPDHVEALASRGAAALADGRLDVAAACIEQLLRIEPEQARWWRALVEIRHAAGVPADRIAQECGLDAYVAWIDFLLRQDRNEQAVLAAVALHQTYTASAPLELHVALGRAWLACGDVNRAIGLVQASGEPVTLIEFLTQVQARYSDDTVISALLTEALDAAEARDTDALDETEPHPFVKGIR